MSKRTLSIEIDCGDKTCYCQPGTHCPYVGTSHFGQRWHCMLFGQKELQEENGWLQRCKECLAFESPNFSMSPFSLGGDPWISIFRHCDKKKWYSTADLYKMITKSDFSKEQSTYLIRRINKVMISLGWARQRRTINGEKLRGYIYLSRSN